MIRFVRCQDIVSCVLKQAVSKCRWAAAQEIAVAASAAASYITGWQRTDNVHAPKVKRSVRTAGATPTHLVRFDIPDGAVPGDSCCHELCSCQMRIPPFTSGSEESSYVARVCETTVTPLASQPNPGKEC